MVRNELKAIATMLNPNSIAVIGASRNTEKLGGRLVLILSRYGYRGKIYPVNPGANEILGLKCYSSVKNIPSDVDLACIVLPARVLPQAVFECVQKRVKVAIIYAGGFAEVGGEGKKLQDRILEIAKGKMRICGPNCLGVISAHTGLYASFSYILEKPLPLGEIGFVSQSGAVSAGLITRMAERGLGIGYWISCGNEADLKTSDYLEFLAKDPDTKVIVSFLEGVRNGKGFVKAIEAAAKARKPVIILKTGRSEAGKFSTKSHTAALAGSYEVYNALFKQLGVIEANDIEDLFEFAMPLAWQPLPKGDRVGVISTSGGACAVIADACKDAGLQLATFTEETIEKLRELIPEFVTLRNPVDVGWLPLEVYGKCVETMAKDENVDVVLFQETASIDPIFFSIIKPFVKAVREANRRGKPCFLSCIPALSYIPDSVKLITQEKVPLYPSPERAVRAIKVVVRYSGFLKRSKRNRNYMP